MNSSDKRIANALREELNLTEQQASDEAILEGSEGTFMRARIELGIALADFIAAIMMTVLRTKEWPPNEKGHKVNSTRRQIYASRKDHRNRNTHIRRR
jgi:hypothetical protein